MTKLCIQTRSSKVLHCDSVRHTQCLLQATADPQSFYWTGDEQERLTHPDLTRQNMLWEETPPWFCTQREDQLQNWPSDNLVPTTLHDEVASMIWLLSQHCFVWSVTLVWAATRMKVVFEKPAWHVIKLSGQQWKSCLAAHQAGCSNTKVWLGRLPLKLPISTAWLLGNCLSSTSLLVRSSTYM